MSRNKLRFYLDENMNPEIANQLVRHGIDALAARDAGMLKTNDLEQLRFATEHGRAICTEDADFAYQAMFNVEPAGIAFFPSRNRAIGYIVSSLRELHHTETTESIRNNLKYL